jgi:hypothetical protein
MIVGTITNNVAFFSLDKTKISMVKKIEVEKEEITSVAFC